MDWRTSVVGGAVLGAVVSCWQVIAAAGGLTSVFVPMATLMQVVVVVGVLYRLRVAQGYGRQVLAGTVVSVVAAAMIGVCSMVTLTVLVPGALEAMQAETLASLQASGATPEQTEATLRMIAPVPQAVMGVVGTLVTGVLLSLLVAIGLRKRAV